MKTLVSGLLLLLATSASVIGQDGKGTSESFLLRVSNSQLFLHATGPINLRNCLVVFSDGRMQLELFRQEFFGSADAKSYEGKLTGSELQILTSMLNQPSIENLSDFVAPQLPMHTDEFSVFIVDIRRAGSLRTVGFFDWKGESPTNADGQKQNWQRAKVALQPLVEWSDWAKSDAHTSRWRRVHQTPASCSMEHDD
jgi:hypothetical protein